MNIRFYHARILTMAEGMKIIEGELHVKGNRIAYVGEGRLCGRRRKRMRL